MIQNRNTGYQVKLLLHTTIPLTPQSIRREQLGLPPVSSLKSRNRAAEEEAGLDSANSAGCPCQHFMSKGESRKWQ